MHIGNVVHLNYIDPPSQKQFKVSAFPGLVALASAVAAHLRIDRTLYVELVSAERYQLAEIRAAYFCWLREKSRAADSDGATIDELHLRHKATYLLPLLCRENQEFADLVYRETVDGVTSPIVIRLLSVADSSVTTPAIMREYFEACQQGGIRDGY